MMTTKNNKQVLVNFVSFVAFVSERSPWIVDAYGS
jgi:hypothetical protein